MNILESNIIKIVFALEAYIIALYVNHIIIEFWKLSFQKLFIRILL